MPPLLYTTTLGVGASTYEFCRNANGHGAPKGNQNAKKKNKQPKQTTLNVNGNENDNKNVNSNEHEASASGSLVAAGSEPMEGVEYTGEELLRMMGVKE